MWGWGTAPRGHGATLGACCGGTCSGHLHQWSLAPPGTASPVPLPRRALSQKGFWAAPSPIQSKDPPSSSPCSYRSSVTAPANSSVALPPPEMPPALAPSTRGHPTALSTALPGSHPQPCSLPSALGPPPAGTPPPRNQAPHPASKTCPFSPSLPPQLTPALFVQMCRGRPWSTRAGVAGMRPRAGCEAKPPCRDSRWRGGCAERLQGHKGDEQT